MRKNRLLIAAYQCADVILSKTLGTPRQKALVDYIVAKRAAAGLTQAELARKLGEYQSFVARLESGQRRVDVVEFLELADILRFDPAKAMSSIRRARER